MSSSDSLSSDSVDFSSPASPAVISSGSRVDPHFHVVSPPLTDSSREAIATLRSSLLLTSPYSTSLYARSYCTDLVLYQFLRARSFDQKKSLSLLVANLEWREKVRPDSISSSEVEVESKTGKMTVEEWDRHGRPIWIMDNRRQDKFRSHDSAMKHLLFHLERTKMIMNRSNQQRRRNSNCSTSSTCSTSSSPIIRDIGSIEKYCLFIHLEGYSVFNAPPIKTALETLKCLTDRYVEHLGSAIVYQAPAYFNVLWLAAKPFLDKQTATKIIFINGDVSEGSHNDRILKDVIGENWKRQCDVPLPGDKLKRKEYQHHQVWPRMKTEQEEWIALLKREREELEKKENEEKEKKMEQKGKDRLGQAETESNAGETNAGETNSDSGKINENAEGESISTPPANANPTVVPISAAS